MKIRNRYIGVAAAATFAIVAALGGFINSAPSVSEVFKARVVRIVDGDSLYLNGVEPQIRLWGVDAPERDEDGFNAATNHLRNIADGGELECRQVDQDRYGRIVARCFLSDDQEVNRMMIDSGTAEEYMKYTKGYYGR